MTLGIEQLRKLYIEDLSRIVTYTENPRSRVKHPGNWERLNRISLREGISEPLSLPLINDDRDVYCWSDLHFNHKNVIKFSDRPFDDIEQMNEHLIANYNDYVKPNDICIWVGDVGFGSTTSINNILSQCNGYKILIVGNHDFKKRNIRALEFDETHLLYMIDYPDVSMVFTHYPMFNIPEPYINIHGHLHITYGRETGHPRHINVNCEVQEYKPRLLTDITKQARVRLEASKL